MPAPPPPGMRKPTGKRGGRRPARRRPTWPRRAEPQVPEECSLPAGVLRAQHGPEPRPRGLQPAAHQRPGERGRGSTAAQHPRRNTESREAQASPRRAQLHSAASFLLHTYIGMGAEDHLLLADFL
nr:uncharacterized protein C17orf67 homolog isoform X1 [Pan paniscus]